MIPMRIHRSLRPHVAGGQAMLLTLVVLGFLTSTLVLTGANSLIQHAEVANIMENKAFASAAAMGCMEHALDQLGLNGSYAGNESLSVASTTCSIQPVVSGASSWTLDTWARSNDQYARYRVILSSRLPLVISSWKEMVSF